MDPLGRPTRRRKQKTKVREHRIEPRWGIVNPRPILNCG